MILAATFPTMPRLWAFIRTGDRNAQQYISNKRRSASHPSRKTRQSIFVKQSSSPEDNIPLKGIYTELQSERRKKSLGMQILKTEEYEVTSQIAALPAMP